MSEAKLRQSMKNFGDALDGLEEALTWPTDHPAYRDATILRFTLVYELAWKTLKRFLDHEKIEANYPKEVLKTAYQIH
jgi:nucleotidyltransferase substrate binding protein (TIGR01987 family)